MNEKDLEKNLNGEEIDERADGETAVLNGEVVNLDDETSVDNENSDWKFDAEVPTLDDSLELKGGFELDIPTENAKSFVSSGSTNDEIATIRVRKTPVKIVCGVLVGLIIAAVLLFFGIRYYTVPNTEEKMNPGNIALTVGDTDISIGLYDYFYASVVYNAEQYANYGYNNLDTSKDYSQQYTEDDDGNQITWLEKFREDTITGIKTIVVYYEKGVQSGITLSDEQKESIDQQIESLESNAANSDKSVNEYIQEVYGDNCGVATLRKYLEFYLIGSEYYNQMSIEERPSDEAAEAYYNENIGNYQSCSYALIETAYDTESEETKAQSLEKIKDYAQQIKSLDDMKTMLPEVSGEFIKQYISMGYFEDEETAVKTLSDSLETSAVKTNVQTYFGKEISDWLFSADTAVGSTNYYLSEDNASAAIILKTGEPKPDETEVYSVRHILVTPEKAETDETQSDAANTQQTEYTEEEWLTAQNKADEILALYNSGEKTETAFAKLAEENSQDTESTSKGSSGLYGGAYEGVSLGQMVPEFEQWATDKNRRAGDVGIVKSQYGYHIMYFIYDGPVCKLNAKNDLMNKNQQEVFDNTEVKEHKAFDKTMVAKPSSNTASGSAE